MTHCARDSLDVGRLVTNGHFDNTWEINKREVWACVGINIQHDWLVDDVLVFTAQFIRQTINVISHFREVEELFAWNFLRENGPRLCLLVQMIESQFKWTTSDSSFTARQEV